ncbi:hypothetical protein AX14_002584 [Amanita brunnescens Koide BX004]|nr:hypothetical protein AX14_013355 [Amanita brunnescens Koide BX004]KAF8724504.1 hypothetical protein AX14_008736 [Amanita brunnescens Koide BX004]KAF8735187.1 hypothetical protein AX14_002584 [Amanita brunnescens Koide BX004]
MADIQLPVWIQWLSVYATLDALFSPPGANAAISQSPFNSQPPFNTQNYPFGSSPHGFTAGAGGRNTNPANVEVALPASPAPNRSVSPNFAGSAPSNSGLNGTLSNFSYIATSYHGAPRTTAFPTSPTSNGQDLQFPDNANATAQSVYIGNLSMPSSQSSNTTNLSTLPSQSPGNTDFSTQSFQFVAENMIGGATNGGTATVGSTPSERSPTHNGQTSPERGAAPSPANALANNEALANAPLERQTGFLGF